MKLLLAQGNPGTQYNDTRHNIGFQILDKFAGNKDAVFVSKPKFFAKIAELTMDAEKILLVKPTTFYNETGRAYRALLDFYKIAPEDSMIIHDELSLPLGTLRVRQGGSDAGNNGIKSLNAYGGTQSYRLRVGIRTPIAQRANDTDYVLGRFSAEERDVLDALTNQVDEIIHDFISGELETTTHRHDQ